MSNYAQFKKMGYTKPYLAQHWVAGNWNTPAFDEKLKDLEIVDVKKMVVKEQLQSVVDYEVVDLKEVYGTALTYLYSTIGIDHADLAKITGVYPETAKTWLEGGRTPVVNFPEVTRRMCKYALNCLKAGDKKLSIRPSSQLIKQHRTSGEKKRTKSIASAKKKAPKAPKPMKTERVLKTVSDPTVNLLESDQLLSAAFGIATLALSMKDEDKLKSSIAVLKLAFERAK